MGTKSRYARRLRRPIVVVINNPPPPSPPSSPWPKALMALGSLVVGWFKFRNGGEG